MTPAELAQHYRAEAASVAKWDGDYAVHIARLNATAAHLDRLAFLVRTGACVVRPGAGTSAWKWLCTNTPSDDCGYYLYELGRGETWEAAIDDAMQKERK